MQTSFIKKIDTSKDIIDAITECQESVNKLREKIGKNFLKN